MRKVLWYVRFYVAKAYIQFICWICRKADDNYSLYSVGEILCEISMELAGKIHCPDKIIEWFLDTGLHILDEAVHNEADNIKKLYGIDRDTDIDDVDEEIIEEYFGERIRR